MISMRRFSLILLFAALTAFSQERKWPILTIKVDGLKNFSQAQVLAVAGVKIGEQASKEVFEAARDRLVATGAFEEVSYRYTPTADGKGYAATIQVSEVLPVYPVRFEELPATAAELTAELRKADPLFGKQIPAHAADREALRDGDRRLSGPN